MVLWNIKLLKQHLIEDGLSQKHLFAYVFMFIMFHEIIEVALFYLPSERLNTYDHVATIIHFITVALGTYLIYWANGGSEGKKFTERFFSIIIVMVVRFNNILILALLILFFGQNQLEGNKVSTLFDATVFPGLLIALFWRVIVHIKDVAACTQFEPRTTKFSKMNALCCAHASALAYKDKPVVTQQFSKLQ